MKRIFYFIVGALVAIAALTASAFAQDTTIRVSDILSPWTEMLMSAVSILIGGFILYITSWVRTKFGIDVEARHREALQAALENGAGLILAKTTDNFANRTIDVQNPLIRQAVTYVIDAAPDAVKKFGLAPDDLAEKLVAKLGLATAPATTSPTPTTGGGLTGSGTLKPVA